MASVTQALGKGWRSWLITLAATLLLLVSAELSRAADAAGAGDTIVSADAPGDQPDNPFKGDIEPQIVPSPSATVTLPLGAGITLLDYDVSPIGPLAIIVLKTAAGDEAIRFWDFSQGGAAEARQWAVPKGLVLSSIAWHPWGKNFFLAGARGGKSEILRADAGQAAWSAQTIYRSDRQIRRVIVGPRPFDHSGDNGPTERNYRVFFGLNRPDGSWGIQSVTEAGKYEYAVIAAKPPASSDDDPDKPHTLAAPSALPVGFHPSGSIMIWEDARHCFQRANYGGKNWEDTAALLKGQTVCNGGVGFTPNGGALLRWRSGHGELSYTLDRGAREMPIDTGGPLLWQPSSAADGKGVVVAVADAATKAVTLRYLPAAPPLASVVNAWMFSETPDDTRRLETDAGMLRLLDDQQLYSLYDSEAYACGAYAQATPTRPYLVTTDAFWEVWASAFEGVFVLNERQRAVPDFWKLVRVAAPALAAAAPDAPVTKAFAVAAALEAGAAKPGNPEITAEAGRVRSATGTAHSIVTGQDFDFAQLVPHGHYAEDPDLATYFRAVHYLTGLDLKPDALKPLSALPANIQAMALSWIRSYAPFSAPPRRPLVWQGSGIGTAAYASHPLPDPSIFPLFWGIDNEALAVSVDHGDWPEAERIKGRLLPNTLEVAAVLGSPLARQLLDATGEFTRYPNLKTALDGAPKRYADTRGGGGTLYTAWLDALAVQWAGVSGTAPTGFKGSLWPVKRLATGLASWATLRHATLLVNDLSAAECGEGGFEQLQMRPPRGYVEPDPATFRAIAGLLLETDRVVHDLGTGWPQTDGNKRLIDGLSRRLKAANAKAMRFAAIAEKEVADTPRTDEEYQDILYVGRAVEHDFLLFKSLARKDFALSNPDPVDKVAEVASDGAGNLLLAAVGAPLEWDQVVPFYGRQQVVKGVSYSYYALAHKGVMTDADWAKNRTSRVPPAWIKPYLTDNKLSCPPLPP